MKKRKIWTAIPALVAASLVSLPFLSSCGANKQVEQNIGVLTDLLSNERHRVNNLSLSIEAMTDSELSNVNTENVLDKVKGFDKQSQFRYRVSDFNKDTVKKVISFVVTIAHDTSSSQTDNTTIKTKQFSVPYALADEGTSSPSNSGVNSGTVSNTTTTNNPTSQPNASLVNKPQEEQPTVAPAWNKQGGSHNSLTVSGYLSVVQLLGFSNGTKLSTLTDDSLNKALKAHEEYKELTLSIQDGSSEKEGTLKLKISGKHNGEDVNGDITITGFATNSFSSFSVSNLQLNLENYFGNSQPLYETNKQVTVSDSLDIKKSIVGEETVFTFSNGVSYTWEEMVKLFDVSNITIKQENNRNNNLFRFNFLFENSSNVYKDKKWTSDTEKATLSQATNSQPTVKIPVQKDLLDFMLTKMEVKSTINDYYPSYFKGRGKYSQSVRSDLTFIEQHIDVDKVVNKYKDTYLKEKAIGAKVDYSSGSISADDFSGTLSFPMYLYVDNDYNANTNSNHRQFSASGLKNITEFVKTNKARQNIITIKDNVSGLAGQIKRTLRDNIDKLFNEQKSSEITLNSTDSYGLHYYLTRTSSTWLSNIFDPDRGSQEDVIKHINDNYTLSLLGFTLEEFAGLQGRFDGRNRAAFDLDTGLFSHNGQNNTAFTVRNVYFDFGYNSSDLKVKLSMNDNTNVVTVSFPSKLNLSISNENVEQESQFMFTITKTAWDSWKQQINSRRK